MPDSVFQLDDRIFFHSDRNLLSRKNKRRRALHLREQRLVHKLFAGWKAVEYLIIKCRPHYLLHKFTAVFIAEVYVPPHVNANATLKELHDTVSSLQNKHPEALYVAAGDFNHVNLQDTLPTFHQYVTIATRGDNTLDGVYTNRQGMYRAAPTLAPPITFPSCWSLHTALWLRA